MASGYDKFKNLQWNIKEITPNSISQHHSLMCLMMDIRGELQRLNQLLHCKNFQEIPKTLKKIAAKKRKPRVNKEKTNGR